MKKSAFVNLILGTIGGLLFALGMCMCLLPEWNAFQPGVICTAIGAVILVVQFVVAWIRSGRKIKMRARFCTACFPLWCWVWVCA